MIRIKKRKNKVQEVYRFFREKILKYENEGGAYQKFAQEVFKKQLEMRKIQMRQRAEEKDKIKRRKRVHT